MAEFTASNAASRASMTWAEYEIREVVVTEMFAAIGRFAVRFRWAVVAVWVAGTIAAIYFLPSLASVTQSGNSAFLPASAPSEQAARLAAAFGQAGLTNGIAIPAVAARPGAVLSAADQTAAARLRSALAAVPGVIQVQDLGRSPDGRAEQVEILAADVADATPLVTNIRKAIARVPVPAGLQVHLAGSTAAQVDSAAKAGSTGSQVQLFSVIFIISLLLLIFRAPLAPLVTLVPALLVVIISGQLIAEAGHAGLKVSVLAQLMLIVLVLGAGTDYGLFLVFRVREELRGGLPPNEAVIRATARVGESISFSGATVIAALLSLLLASFAIYSDLGIPLAIGIGLMLVAGLSLLPALLAIFGRAVFWPSATRGGERRPGTWARICARVVHRPAVTLLIGLLVFGGLAFAASGYRASGFAGPQAAPAGTDSAAGTALLAAHFPTSTANPTYLIYVLGRPAWADAEPLMVAWQQLRTAPEFTHMTGPLNPNGIALSTADLLRLHAELGAAQDLAPTPRPGSPVPPAAYQAYRATASYVSRDGRTVQFVTSLSAGDPSSTEAIDAIPGIRARANLAARVIGAVRYGVTGEAPIFYDISNISGSDLIRVIPVAIIVIGVLLALVMRSLVAPLYLVASVAFSYLAALGLAVILFIDLGNAGGLVFVLPFLMFLFLLALGEDYNILVMTRIREEAGTLPLRMAVIRALGTTGTTVTSAGLVLAGTFAVFAVVGGSGSGGSEVRDVGFGLALGILMDTFLVRTLLVPSTVLLLGRWNWWPSKHGTWMGVPAARPESAGAITEPTEAAHPHVDGSSS